MIFKNMTTVILEIHNNSIIYIILSLLILRIAISLIKIDIVSFITYFVFVYLKIFI
jgi:hypothetical protein